MNLLGALVDDAGLFPPESLAMADEARAVPGRELSAARLLFRAYGS